MSSRHSGFKATVYLQGIVSLWMYILNGCYQKKIIKEIITHMPILVNQRIYWCYLQEYGEGSFQRAWMTLSPNLTPV